VTNISKLNLRLNPERVNAGRPEKIADFGVIATLLIGRQAVLD